MFFKKKKIMYTIHYGGAILEYNEKQFEELLEHCNEDGSYAIITKILKREV